MAERVKETYRLPVELWRTILLSQLTQSQSRWQLKEPKACQHIVELRTTKDAQHETWFTQNDDRK